MAAIILDNSAFRSATRERLHAFESKHTVLLPHTLDYETATAEPKWQQSLTWPSFFGKLSHMRPYVCQPVFWLMNQEKITKRPTSDIINHEATQELQRALGEGFVPSDRERRESPLEPFFEQAEPASFRENIEELFDERFRDLFEEALKTKREGLCTVAQAYVRLIPEDRLEEAFSLMPADGVRGWPPYVLRRGWLSFLYVRLRNYAAFWYRFNTPEARR